MNQIKLYEPKYIAEYMFGKEKRWIYLPVKSDQEMEDLYRKTVLEGSPIMVDGMITILPKYGTEFRKQDIKNDIDYVLFSVDKDVQESLIALRDEIIKMKFRKVNLDILWNTYQSRILQIPESKREIGLSPDEIIEKLKK